MNKRLWSLAVFVTLVTVACNQVAPSKPDGGSIAQSSSPSAPPPPLPVESSAVPSGPSNVTNLAIDEFAFEEISGRGCGMSLWRPDRQTRDRYLFFNALNDELNENPMEMKLNGEIVRFRRTEASGTEFYGQTTSQTFVSEDGSTQVTAAVELGELGEIESVAIQSGTLRVSQSGQTIEIPVVGDAGC